MPNFLQMTKNITWVYHECKLRTEAPFDFHPATLPTTLTLLRRVESSNCGLLCNFLHFQQRISVRDTHDTG
jgi:hypothetical protein